MVKLGIPSSAQHPRHRAPSGHFAPPSGQPTISHLRNNHFICCRRFCSSSCDRMKVADQGFRQPLRFVAFKFQYRSHSLFSSSRTPFHKAAEEKWRQPLSRLQYILSSSILKFAEDSGATPVIRRSIRTWTPSSQHGEVRLNQDQTGELRHDYDCARRRAPRELRGDLLTERAVCKAPFGGLHFTMYPSLLSLENRNKRG